MICLLTAVRLCCAYDNDRYNLCPRDQSRIPDARNDHIVVLVRTGMIVSQARRAAVGGVHCDVRRRRKTVR